MVSLGVVTAVAAGLDTIRGVTERLLRR